MNKYFNKVFSKIWTSCQSDLLVYNFWSGHRQDVSWKCWHWEQQQTFLWGTFVIIFCRSVAMPPAPLCTVHSSRLGQLSRASCQTSSCKHDPHSPGRSPLGAGRSETVFLRLSRHPRLSQIIPQRRKQTVHPRYKLKYVSNIVYIYIYVSLFCSADTSNKLT